MFYTDFSPCKRTLVTQYALEVKNVDHHS